MLKLKLQYFGHLMWRTDSLEKTLMLGKIEGRSRRDDRGWDGWMALLTQWTWVWAGSRRWWIDREAWHAAVHGVAKHWTQLSDSAFRCLHLSFSPLFSVSLLFTAICKASPDSHFAFFHFFSMGMVLIPVSCTMSRTSFHSSSGTLSIRSRPLNLFLTSTV